MKELLRAAFVNARRDFTAVIFSKAVICFLLGPLFPVLIGAIAGYLGEDMSGANEPPSVGLVLGEGETKALIKARERLASALGPTTIPQLKSGPTDGDAAAIAAMLPRPEHNVHAVFSGPLARPVLPCEDGDGARLTGEIS